MRVMAIDFGDVRTGIAVSDAMGILAGETWVITERDMNALAQQIAAAAQERGVGQLVLGYPRNMDGTAGSRAEKSAAFGKSLETMTNLPLKLWDERRTSVAADNILKDAGRRGKKRKQLQDAVAASLILEGYLLQQGNSVGGDA